MRARLIIAIPLFLPVIARANPASNVGSHLIILHSAASASASCAPPRRGQEGAIGGARRRASLRPPGPSGRNPWRGRGVEPVR